MRYCDEHDVCPVISDPHMLAPCLKERCAWWWPEKNEDYSSCAIHLVKKQLESIFFEVRE